MASIQDVNKTLKVLPKDPDKDTLINTLKTRKPVSVAPYDRVRPGDKSAAEATVVDGCFARWMEFIEEDMLDTDMKSRNGGMAEDFFEQQDCIHMVERR